MKWLKPVPNKAVYNGNSLGSHFAKTRSEKFDSILEKLILHNHSKLH